MCKRKSQQATKEPNTKRKVKRLQRKRIWVSESGLNVNSPLTLSSNTEWIEWLDIFIKADDLKILILS